MSSSTLRTIVGFARSWLARRIPFLKVSPTVEGIYNYVDIVDLFPTSGQPSEEELELMCSAGYDVVINLAPTSVLENSVVKEAEILHRNHVEYLHLPVDFKDPTEEDFQHFVDALEQRKNHKVWVHCAANMRVSAFTYRYRVSVCGVDEESAREDLHKIWEPFGVWKMFIERAT